MKHPIVPGACLLLGLLACHELPTSSGDSLPLRRVFSATSAVYFPAARTEVINTQERLVEVWREIHPGDLGLNAPPVPAVDFSRESVLFAARGLQPDGCHSIRIVDAIRSGSLVNAEVEAVDSQGCGCTLEVIYPLEMVAVPVPNARASFRERTVVKHCP